mmetsp:Transcript_3022/g.12421  ORF Transcript_3022/g.12421 Transcript_3022/m.12421 type:complete len:203 (-) Transcript_3022:2180-2788(-)
MPRNSSPALDPPPLLHKLALLRRRQGRGQPGWRRTRSGCPRSSASRQWASLERRLQNACTFEWTCLGGTGIPWSASTAALLSKGARGACPRRCPPEATKHHFSETRTPNCLPGLGWRRIRPRLPRPCWSQRSEGCHPRARRRCARSLQKFRRRRPPQLPCRPPRGCQRPLAGHWGLLRRWGSWPAPVVPVSCCPWRPRCRLA